MSSQQPDVLEMRVLHQLIERLIRHRRHVRALEDLEPLGGGLLLQPFGADAEILATCS